MDSTTSILLTVIFSAIGMGYIVYGKQQRQAVALICGILLCTYTYFISGMMSIITIGIGLMLVPFYLGN